MFTLQILHASDLEGGVEAIANAPNFAAVVDALETDAAAEGISSITLSAGDNYIPGPFFNAGGDFSLAPVYEGFYNELFGLIDAEVLSLAGADTNGDGFFDNDEIETVITAGTVTFDEAYTTDVNGDGFKDYFEEIDTFEGRLDIAIMNAIGFDASAVGNHEFDAGTDAFENIINYDSEEGNSLSTSRYNASGEVPGHLNFLQEVDTPGAQFPYLSANLDFSQDFDVGALFDDTILPSDAFNSDLASARDPVPGSEADFPAVFDTAGTSDSNDQKVAPATIIEQDGERIGVIGATTQLVAQLSSTGTIDDVSNPGANDMPALAAVLQPVVDDLIADGVNKIVLVSHLQQFALEQELATLLAGVDVIIAGGSDTILADETDDLRAEDEGGTFGDYPFETTDANGDPVVVVSTDGTYSYVGRLVVDFDENGILINRGDGELVDAEESGAFATDADGVANAVGEVTGARDLELSEAQEVEAVPDGPATGSVSAFLSGNTLYVEGTFTGLSSDLFDTSADGVDAEGNPIDSIHIHNAPAGVNGPIIRALDVVDNSDGSGSFSGTFTLTDAEVDEFNAGNLYINIHTGTNNAGELRGQLEGIGPVEPTVEAAIAFSETATDVKNLAEAVTDIVTALDGDIAGETEVFLNGLREFVRTEETNLGNLTADANIAAVNKAGFAATVSIKNGGGIRAPIGEIDGDTGEFLVPQANSVSGKDEGEISELDIDNALRFDNDLVIVELSTADLKIILEHAVAETEEGSTPGQFAQVGGIHFSFDPSGTAQELGEDGLPVVEGTRIRNVTLVDGNGNGVPTDLIIEDGEVVPGAPDVIRVVTLGFLADGGDGYPFAALGPVTETGIGEQQALSDFLTENFPEDTDAPFDDADRPAGADARIQNLAERADTVDAPVATRDLRFEAVAEFDSGSIFGGSEVVAHEGGVLYVTNGNAGAIDIFDIATGTQTGSIDLTGLDGFESVQSVAVKNGVVAAAIARGPVTQTVNGEEFNVSQPGFVALFDAATGTLRSRVDVGNLPDQLTFSEDGSTLLVAGEGQFNEDSVADGENDDDPLGTITVIDTSDPTAPVASIVDFAALSGAIEAALVEDGVRIQPGNSFAEDAEPEFITLSPDGSTAYVSLQENNSIAVFDIASQTVTDVFGLGVVDRSVVPFDPNDDGVIDIRTFDGVVSLRQPDAIKAFEVNGTRYIATANEGDNRGDFDQTDLEDLTLDPALEASLGPDGLEALSEIEVSFVDGDTDGDGDIDVLHTFGGRSFSIFDIEGNLVFDSGAEFEKIIAEIAPERFNDDDGDTDGDEDRSDDAGPEPEAIEIGVVDGVTYAFVGLERDSGIMIYDVSDPENSEFVNYIPPLFIDDVGPGETGRHSPEIIEFIPANESTSGNAQIAVAYEVSGTTIVYDLTPEAVTLIGDAGRNVLAGGEGDDMIAGRESADLLTGAEGDDTILGEEGADEIEGNEGEDRIVAGDGRDQADGGAGRDMIFGGEGTDLLFGGTGDDMINAGAGRDSVEGGDQDDGIAGGNEADILIGGAGDDSVKGGTGRDTIVGGEGDDVLIGGEANDLIDGGEGDDTITGGAGDDTIVTGDGADMLRVRGDFGLDTVSDFTIGEDVVDLRSLRAENGGSPLDFDQLIVGSEAGSARIRLDIDRDGVADTPDLDGDGDGDAVQVVLAGVEPRAVSDSDFLF